MFLFLCVGLMDTTEAQHLPVSGQGENLWVLQTDDVNQGLKVLYRHVSDEPGALTAARRLTGRLARQGLAGGQNQLWLVYEGNFVQSLRSTVISSSGPVIRQWSTRVEPSLPPGVRIVSMAAGRHGPWVLLEIDNAQTLDKIDAWVGQSVDQIATIRSAVTEPGTATPNVESPAKPSAGTESSKTVTPIIQTSPDPAGGKLQKVLTEPVERLVHLDRNTWKKVPLPEDWKGHAGAFVVMAGPVLSHLYWCVCCDRKLRGVAPREIRKQAG
ncbi:MAG: hypothetical protein HC898_09645 [Phycisphaerales bacterium]|nr:hypothetical protein [Phycisphaerales bacterium]